MNIQRTKICEFFVRKLQSDMNTGLSIAQGATSSVTVQKKGGPLKDVKSHDKKKNTSCSWGPLSLLRGVGNFDKICSVCDENMKFSTQNKELISMCMYIVIRIIIYKYYTYNYKCNKNILIITCKNKEFSSQHSLDVATFSTFLRK
jgi:hypothetical protein